MLVRVYVYLYSSVYLSIQRFSTVLHQQHKEHIIPIQIVIFYFLVNHRNIYLCYPLQKHIFIACFKYYC